MYSLFSIERLLQSISWPSYAHGSVSAARHVRSRLQETTSCQDRGSSSKAKALKLPAPSGPASSAGSCQAPPGDRTAAITQHYYGTTNPTFHREHVLYPFLTPTNVYSTLPNRY